MISALPLLPICVPPPDASPLGSSSSSRRSHFSAHKTILTPGQYSFISPIHFDSTFSRESRLSTWLGLETMSQRVREEQYAETKHYCLGVGIGEGAQAVEFFLASSVP